MAIHTMKARAFIVNLTIILAESGRMAIHTVKARAFIVNLTIILAENGRMAIHKSSILYWEKRVYMIEKIKGLMKKYQEMIAYLIVGGLTTLVSWGAMYLVSWLLFDNPLHPTSFQNAVMSTANWVAGVTFAYFTNRRFVFKSHEPMLKEIPKFVLSRVSTFILDLAIRQLFGALGINTYITTFVSAVLVFIGNYVLSKLLVFQKGKSNCSEV